MTVSSQVKQTLASLKGVKATLDIYSSQSTVEEEREVFLENSKEIEAIIDDLEQRVGQIEWEEPQYKGY